MKEVETPRSVKQFLKIDLDSIFDNFDRRGEFTVESEFVGTRYIVRDGQVGIFTSRNGVLAISIDNVEEFVSELAEIAKIAKDRKRMRIKRA